MNTVKLFLASFLDGISTLLGFNEQKINDEACNSLSKEERDCIESIINTAIK